MSALSGKGSGKQSSAISAELSARLGALVLPRPLRRVIRLFPAIAAMNIPRHLGSVCAALFLGATGVYGMVLGGHTTHVVQVGTTAAGFALEDIAITGNIETSEIDILAQLGLDGSTSLVALDAASARAALLELPWIAGAEVRKVYPDGVEIAITERKAFAIWQNGRELSLIEKGGSVIGPMTHDKFARLPLYVGLGAETEGAAFDQAISAWPALKDRVRAYVRVADRRWDLHMKNGVTIRLPEEHVGDALGELVAMDEAQDLLARDIASVDMRLSDRVTIQLTPAALERREAAIEQRTKDLKALERRI